MFLLQRRHKRAEKEYRQALRAGEIRRLNSLLQKHPHLVSHADLLWAVKHVEILHVLLCYISAPEPLLLHDAVRGNHLAAIQLLLLQEAIDVNSCSDTGVTALHLSKSVECTQILLDAGANIGAVDIHGDTPLHWATCDRQHGDIVALLLQRQGSDGCCHQHANRQGCTALHLVVDMPQACVETMKCLLEGGADVNAVDRKGQSVFSKALVWYFNAETPDNLDVLRLLLQHGAKPNAEMLGNAVEQDSLSLVQLFVHHGVGVTHDVIVSAIQWRRPAILKLLLPLVIDSTCSKQHQVWLSLAAPRTAVLKVLLRFFVVEAKQRKVPYGVALMEAVRLQRWKSVALLMQYGANPWEFVQGGSNPLETACQRDNLTIIYQLVSSRPDFLI